MMNCRIYRSGKNDEAYLYLAQQQSFEDLPVELQNAFGDTVFVMALELSRASKLARVDAREVLTSLQTQGYFLQLPPKLTVENELSKQFS